MSGDFDDLAIPSDSLLNVLAHLSVFDLARVSAASRRLCYLVDRLQTDVVGPECVGEFASDGRRQGRRSRKRPRAEEKEEEEEEDRSSVETVLPRALASMRSRPTLALGFAKGGSSRAETIRTSLASCLPRDCSVLVVQSDDIQANCDGKVDADAELSVLLSSFADASFVPFNFDLTDDEDQIARVDPMVDALLSQLKGATPADSDFHSYWKTVFLFSTFCEEQVIVSDFLDLLQAALPDTTIVGGICATGLIRLDLGAHGRNASRGARRVSPRLCGTRTNAQGILLVERSIFGVAIGGNVPIRSVVSRGLRTLMSPATGSFVDGAAAPPNSWIVSSINSEQEHDDDSSIRWISHSIREVQNSATGERLSGRDFFRRVLDTRVGQTLPLYCGLRRTCTGHGSDAEGFKIYDIPDDPDSIFLTDTLMSTRTAEDHNGSEIAVFELDGCACLQDVDSTLDRLRASLEGERILGSVMISCNGRGPRADDTGIMGEDMADALHFHQRFPNVPCTGFYAYGEIGPDASWGRRDIFRVGLAALLNYTAVFALFIVPVSRQKHRIDDGPESVKQYMEKRMQK